LTLKRLSRQSPPNGPAKWRAATATSVDGGGEIGVIASVTHPFCHDCDRMRLAPDGQLYTCLFASDGHNLRALLAADASDDELRARLASIWRTRSDRYSEERALQPKGERPRKVEMFRIGG